MTADLEAVTHTLADVIDAAMRAVNDPGQFCKRGRNANGYVDTLNMWQRRALALALPPVLASIPDDRLAPVGNRDGVASWLQMAVGDRGPALADGLFEAGRILPDDRLAEAEAKVQRVEALLAKPHTTHVLTGKAETTGVRATVYVDDLRAALSGGDAT